MNISPAPGCRGRDTGMLYVVGDGQYSWSSAIPTGGFNARILGFRNSWVNPQGTYDRGNGYQVRCLLE